MNKILIIVVIGILLLLCSCSRDEFPLPDIPTAGTIPNTGDANYIPINPPLDAANGYDFNKPADIYYGADNFLYIADTENNRIVMMDLGGAIQGFSQPISQPEAITQNDSLQLLIVNKTNAIYKIDLFEYNHQINQAPVERVFIEESQPFREFTGITVHNGFEYYVSVIDTEPGQTQSFIYDFRADHFLKGPLPLEVNGSGLFSVLLPTAIVSFREQYLDISSRETSIEFMFCQKGEFLQLQLQSFYKVQHITTRKLEGEDVLAPNTAFINKEIYDYRLLYNPEDITLDRSGNIYIVDTGEGTPGGHPAGFYRFSSTGVLRQSFTNDSESDVKFLNPKGIAVLPFSEGEQVVYVADTGNNRILLFELSTEI